VLEGELQFTIAMLRDQWFEIAKGIKETDRLLVAQAKEDSLDTVCYPCWHTPLPKPTQSAE
jgi:hypothetical protein